MAQVLIDLYRGLVSAVYSNGLEDLHVRILDSDDKYEPDHASLFAACQYAVEHGGLIDHMYKSETEERIMDEPLARIPETLQLIAEDNQAASEEGRSVQQLDAAFAGGFLQAIADLNGFLRKLAESDPGEGRAAYQILHQFIDRQYGRYYDFCEDLNDSDRYIGGADRSAKTETD